MEETLTPSEVAVFFKIHLNTVYRLANRGIIPGYRVGRGWRFHKTDMVTVLSRQQRKTAKANQGGFRKGQKKASISATKLTIAGRQAERKRGE